MFIFLSIHINKSIADYYHLYPVANISFYHLHKIWELVTTLQVRNLLQKSNLQNVCPGVAREEKHSTSLHSFFFWVS